MKAFVEELEGKILDTRTLFFDTADLPNETKDEVRKKEKSGDNEFNYRSSISRLVRSLANASQEKRAEIIEAIKKGIDYRATGIYVNHRHCIRQASPPLLADVAIKPEEYFSKI